MSQYEVKHNKEQQRFEVTEQGETGYIDYRYYKDSIAFMHAFLPEAIRGKGIAEQIAKTALDFARAEHKKVMMYCAFVSKYVKAHPEYHDIVDSDYHPSYKRK